MSMEDVRKHLEEAIDTNENLESKCNSRIKSLNALIALPEIQPATKSHLEEEVGDVKKAKVSVASKLNDTYRAIAPMQTVGDVQDDVDAIVTIELFALLKIADQLFITISKSDTTEEVDTIFNTDRVFLMADTFYGFGRVIKQEKMNELIQQGKEIHIYDNRETSLWMNSYPHCLIDTNRSPLKILYDKFITGTKYDIEMVRELVNIVDAHHRWQRDSEYFERGLKLDRLLTAFRNRDGYMGIRPFQRTIERMLEDEKIEYTEDEEKLIKGVIEDEERSYSEAKKSMTIHTDTRGNKFAVYYDVGNKHITATRILEEDKSIQYVCVRYKNNNNLNVISNGFNLLQFANAEGGRFDIWILDYDDFDPENGPQYNLQERGIRKLLSTSSKNESFYITIRK